MTSKSPPQNPPDGPPDGPAALDLQQARIDELRHKLAQAEARVTEAKREAHILRQALDLVPTRVFWKDRNSIFVGCNKAHLADLGFTRPDSLLGTSDDDHPWADHAELYRADDAAVMQGGRGRLRYEEPLVTDFGRRWLMTSKVPLRDLDGTVIGVLGCHDDITQQREVRAALAAAEKRYDQVTRGMPDGLLIVGADGSVTETNPAMARLVGQPETSIAGVGWRSLFDDISEPDLAAQLAKRGSAVFEASIAAQDMPSALHVEVAATSLGQGRWLAVVRDVTARVVSEQKERSLADALHHSQRLESLGRLAGSVAHEFNNMLTVILGSASLAGKRAQVPDDVRRDLDQISRTTERAARLTRQLLAFGRKRVHQREILRVNDLINGLRDILGSASGPDTTFELVLTAADDHVFADRLLLEQVVMALVENARDAMPDGGRLRIRTSEDRNGVRIDVQDSGVGIKPEHLGQVFEPYFSTKEGLHSSGLGLSTAHGIVAQSRGVIEVESDEGVGTTVRVWLPRADEDTGPLPLKAPDDAVLTRPLTVLLVEDDDGIREIATLVLQSAGMVPLAASDAGEALRAVELHSGVIDAVVSDVVMPGKSGPELVRILEGRLPGLPVLFMSGYPADDLADLELHRPQRAFLQKPFLPADLVGALADVVNLTAVHVRRTTRR